MSEKVAFILPGHGFRAEGDPYAQIGEMFEERGITPEYVEIDWQRDLNKNIDQARRKIEKRLEDYNETEVYLFGHSSGASIALAISPQINPEELILASMSPEFEEGFESTPYYQLKIADLATAILRTLGVADYPKHNEFESPSLSELEGEDIGNIYFLYAEREYRGFFGIKSLGYGGNVTENRLELFPEAEEIVVKDAKHWMTSDAYLNAVKRVIEEVID
jgi:Cys-tRNA synthase (O-phospho-L-seryl-tRNA:Cys-tRNA synthase)